MSEDHSSSRGKSWFERFTQAFAHEPKDRQHLLELIHDAHKNGLLDIEALTIVEGAIQVADVQVRDIMVPRSQMVTIKESETLQEFLPVIIDAAHSRYPVLEKDSDDVLGILLVKDLIPHLLALISGKTPGFDIRKLLRRPVFVPESKRLNVLLKEFRADHNHMALVVNEYGEVAGLVTIEDVLEQIVGDIEDEHDVEEESYIRPQPSGDIVVKAQTPLKTINEYFNTHYPEDRFETLGMLVMDAFGHLPKRNETVEIGDFRFRILTADSRRIHLLRLTPLNGVR